MIIENFVDAMVAQDYAAVADCFAEDCRYFDYCPSAAARENVFLYGPNAMNMYFHNAFFFKKYSMMDPQITSDRSVNFFANYQGVVVHAVAEIEDWDGPDRARGKILEMVIRPA